MVRWICIVLLFLLPSVAISEQRDDVIYVKLANIEKSVEEIKASLDAYKTNMDNKIDKNSDVITDLRLCVKDLETKINIMWAVCGATLGGSGVFAFITSRKSRSV